MINDLLQFNSPAVSAEFENGVITIKREGKGDTFEFAYAPLVKQGWAPVTGTSLNGQVTLWWDWRGGDDLASFVDRFGRYSPVSGLSATIEEMAFLYLS